MLHLLKEANPNISGHLCKSKLNKDAGLHGNTINESMDVINPKVRMVVSSLGREEHMKERLEKSWNYFIS